MCSCKAWCWPVKVSQPWWAGKAGLTLASHLLSCLSRLRSARILSTQKNNKTKNTFFLLLTYYLITLTCNVTSWYHSIMSKVRSVFITGANRGIGLQLVKSINARLKPRVLFATYRDVSKAEVRFGKCSKKFMIFYSIRVIGLFMTTD